MPKFKFKPNKREAGCPSNGERADWALAAEKAHAKSRGDAYMPDDSTTIQDMISDLGHLADKRGFDFNEILHMATDNWKAER